MFLHGSESKLEKIRINKSMFGKNILQEFDHIFGNYRNLLKFDDSGILSPLRKIYRPDSY